MPKKPDYTLEEIVESINKHKSVDKGCKALKMTRANFYKRLNTEKLELVKVPVYSLKRKN